MKNQCIKVNFKNSFLVFNLSLLLLIGCSTSKKIVETTVERIPANFDYSPKTTSKVGSANLTVAIVNPSFAGDNYNNTLFKQFSKSMGKDFEELLTSKGITIRGPFDSRGEMLYNDKQQSDFILEPEISFDFTNVTRKVTRNVKKPSFGALLVNANTPTTVSYSYDGKGSYNTNLSLNFKSTNYIEKIDVKNFPIEGTPFEYIGSAAWTTENVSFFDELQQDNLVYNTFVKTLMTQYDAIFEKLEKQMEVEYLTTIKEQAHQIDKKNK